MSWEMIRNLLALWNIGFVNLFSLWSGIIKALVYSSIILLLSIVTSYADYHYASHEGSNEYPYTSWETAADSIQKAIDVAEPGDTVYVGEGTFVENLIMKDTLALIGMGWENTTIDGFNEDSINYTVLFDNPGHGWGSIVEGFTIKGAQLSMDNWFKGVRANAVGGVIVKNNRVIDSYDGVSTFGHINIENNIFENNVTNIIHQLLGNTHIKNNLLRASSYTSYNVYLNYIDSIFFENNIVEACPHNPTVAFNEPNYDVIVKNNLFYHYSDETGTLLSMPYTNYLVLENNTFVGGGLARRGASYFSSRFADSTMEAYIINNSIQGCQQFALRIASVIDTPTIVHYGYNNYWDNESDIVYSGESLVIDTLGEDINDDPMLTGTPDYLLQMHSPCIDAGHPDILDVDGTRSDIGYAGGPGGFSYVYIDLPPEAPDSLWADIVEDTIIIEWDYATEADFNHYNIYRSNESGYTPSVENLLAESDTSIYYDVDWDSTENLYYLVTSVDNQDNESNPSPELGVILTSAFDNDEPFIPYKIELSQNYPNPFNPRTTIEYMIPDLGPQPAQVELMIFNILGEKVKSLVNTRQGVGTYAVVWDGTDDNGNDVSSGVYFYQLKVWGFPIGKVKKMVLMR